ncbi:MAG: hypothetical protein WCP85_10680 [Mariniphaga sp.]
MNLDHKDKFVRELMEKSERKMPFDDFEERLMQQVYKEAKTSSSFLKDIKLSWFFFTIGTIFGLVLNILVAEMNKTIFGIPSQRLLLIVQVLFVMLLLSQFDRLIGLTKNPKRQ